MCKFKDIIKSGYEDFCAQKRRNRVSFLLIMFSMLIFLGVNSAVGSMEKMVNALIYFPDSRIISAVYLEDEHGDMYSKLQDKYKDDKRVRAVFKTSGAQMLGWQNTQDYLGENEVDIRVESFCKPLLDYVDDKKIKDIKYDEVLIPKYLYELGKYDDKTFYKGEKLVGETIELAYYDGYGQLVENFKLKVVGTYDNVLTKFGDDCLYVSEDLIDRLNDLEHGRELVFRDEMIEAGMDPEQCQVSYEKYVAMYISEKYDINEVIREINKDTGLYFIQRTQIAMETYSFFNYAYFVANAVSFLLLVIAFLNIVISSLNEVKERKWEFALKLSMGYTYKDIISIFTIEKVINMFKSLVISGIVVIVLSIGSNLILRTLTGRYGHMIDFKLDIKYAILGVLLVTIAAFAGVVSGRNSIKSIEVAETLKAGD